MTINDDNTVLIMFQPALCPAATGDSVAVP
jgi:hypothetical protein